MYIILTPVDIYFHLGSGCGPEFDVDWSIEREIQCYDECATISKMTVDGISALSFLETDDRKSKVNLQICECVCFDLFRLFSMTSNKRN